MSDKQFTYEEVRDRLSTCVGALNIAGASITVSRGISYIEASAGITDSASDAAVGDDTHFEIGSITKVFTATLMNRLSDLGHVELDAPATQYLPELRIANARAPDSLTVRTLLDYTAGMEGEFFQDFGEGDDALRRYTDACAELGFIHPPGEMRGYNSTAYCLAGRVIEAVTGQAYDTALTELLLQPAGMDNHSFAREAVAGRSYAIGQSLDPETGGFISVGDKRLPRAMTASGARLSMPARELHRFGRLHLQYGRAESGAQLVSPASIEAMRTSFGNVPPNDSERLMGWAAMELGGERVTLASGETISQNAFLVILPKYDFCLSILTNASGGAMQLLGTLGFELMAEMTGVQASLPVPDLTPAPSDISPEQITGTYTNGTLFNISKISDGLQLSMCERPTEGVEGKSESVGLVSLGGARFGLKPAGAPGPVAALEFHFQDPSHAKASHISQGGRLFARVQEPAT